MKTYNIQYGIGRSKYVVNFHDGQKTHKDGSPFFDIRIFKNKRKLETFSRNLSAQGYASNP